MFTDGLNMDLPLRARVKKAVHEVEIQWLFSKKKFWSQWSIKKVRLPIFWDMKEPITIDFLEKGATVNIGSNCQIRRQDSPYLLKEPCI